MAQTIADKKTTTQMEIALGRINSLSTLPNIAANSLQNLSVQNLANLATIIESDPALAVKFILLLQREGIKLSQLNYSLESGLEKLSGHQIRQALLDIEVQAPDNENNILARKELLLYTLAVACCSREISQLLPDPVEPQLAYLAGLLHNIGNFALDSAMPRSFERLLDEAKTDNASICSAQLKYLGMDYTIIGKRLAQRWELPQVLQSAIWLHRSNGQVVGNLTDTKIAQIVRLAIAIVRSEGIGHSADFDQPIASEKIAESLGMGAEQLNVVRQKSIEQLQQKVELLGLDQPGEMANYYRQIQNAAAEIARDNAILVSQTGRSQTGDLAVSLLANINQTTQLIDAARIIAVNWQKAFQAGKVCLYFSTAPGDELIEAVVVEGADKSNFVLLERPSDDTADTEYAGVLDVKDRCNWLFEQLGVIFDLGSSKMVSLGNANGAIVFETGQEELTDGNLECFAQAGLICGKILELAAAGQKWQSFAERMIQLGDSRAENAGEQKGEDSSSLLEGLCEMAAGAAHELNNPLSVISGRAQLLSKSETDEEKQKILKQIQLNANELAGIIDSLMEYANPKAPRKTPITVEQLIDEAIELTKLKTNSESIEVSVEPGSTGVEVLVDSGQIVPAIANILCNSYQSYGGKSGIINISVSNEKEGDFAGLAISDNGFGMDDETVKKATQPFYSAEAAGRKRGMGLAHAQRYIQLNGGSIEIQSSIGVGTKVIVLLPCE